MHLIGVLQLSEKQIAAGDVSGKGGLTAWDAALILMKATGKIDRFSDPSPVPTSLAVVKTGPSGIAETTQLSRQDSLASRAKLVVTSNPSGANVYVGGNYGYLGEYMGDTPLTMDDLSPGTRVVQAAMAGYQTRYSLVELSAGETSRVDMAMSRIAAAEYKALEPLRTIGGDPLQLVSHPVSPCVADWDMDGRKDILIGDSMGTVSCWVNVGTDERPLFSAGTPVLTGLGTYISVFVVDWDNDGKKDLLTGNGDGHVTVYLNQNTDSEPSFQNGTPVASIGNFAKPWIADWDCDRRKDLLVGDGNGCVNLFLNTGTDEAPVFGASSELQIDGSLLLAEGGYAAPCVIDWGCNGVRDLLVGCGTGEVHLFTSDGTDEYCSFSSQEGMQLGGVGFSVHGCAAPFALDWNNDSISDVLVGNSDGEVYLLLGREDRNTKLGRD
jgi:hypothetical protein